MVDPILSSRAHRARHSEYAPPERVSHLADRPPVRLAADPRGRGGRRPAPGIRRRGQVPGVDHLRTGHRHGPGPQRGLRRLIRRGARADTPGRRPREREPSGTVAVDGNYSTAAEESPYGLDPQFASQRSWGAAGREESTLNHRPGATDRATSTPRRTLIVSASFRLPPLGACVTGRKTLQRQ